LEDQTGIGTKVHNQEKATVSQKRNHHILP